MNVSSIIFECRLCFNTCWACLFRQLLVLPNSATLVDARMQSTSHDISRVSSNGVQLLTFIGNGYHVIWTSINQSSPTMEYIISIHSVHIFITQYLARIRIIWLAQFVLEHCEICSSLSKLANKSVYMFVVQIYYITMQCLWTGSVHCCTDCLVGILNLAMLADNKFVRKSNICAIYRLQPLRGEYPYLINRSVFECALIRALRKVTPIEWFFVCLASNLKPISFWYDGLFVWP